MFLLIDIPSDCTYAVVLLASLAGPLVFSFLPQVKFYRHWHWALVASVAVSGLFVPWDVYFTRAGFWGFNETYVLGIYFFSLPLEEVLFFIVIPFCSLFVYECVGAFSFFPKKLYDYRLPSRWFVGLAILFFVGFWFVADRAYTASVIGGSAIVFAFLVFESMQRRIAWGRFVLAYIIVSIPFLIVNGTLTALPVVWYNDTENIAIRAGTIPVEDFFYQFILFSLNVLIFNALVRSERRYIAK